MVKVSIIIPTWNREAELNYILKTLDSQIFKDYEVIVVDDGSEIPFHYDNQKVTVVRTSHGGPTRARNEGLKRVKGEFVWFLDSDIKFFSTLTLHNMVEYLDKNKDVGSIGCEGIRGIPIYRKMRVNGEISSNVLKQRYMEVDIITCCNLMVRKSLLDKIEGFADCYTWGAEEKELCYKIKKLGLKQVVSIDFYVEHLLSKKGGEVRSFDNLIRSRILYLKRNEKFKYYLLPFIDLLTIYSKLRYLLGQKDNITNIMVSRYNGNYIISLLKAYGGVLFDRNKISNIRI